MTTAVLFTPLIRPSTHKPLSTPFTMTFIRGLKSLKVKEVPPYASEYAKANLAPGTLWQRATAHVHSYKAHLDAGSVKPLFDTMALLFVGAYALAWPQVKERERERRESGERGRAWEVPAAAARRRL